MIESKSVKALKKQLAHLSPQKVVIFCVGASPYDEQALAAIKEHNMDGPLKDLPLFYCRGGWDMPAMSFIDRNLCKMLKKATAKNCYSKKEGLFLPQFGSLWEPSFKEEYKSSLTYTLYDDKTLWNDTVKNSHYAHEIFNYLTGQL